MQVSLRGNGTIWRAARWRLALTAAAALVLPSALAPSVAHAAIGFVAANSANNGAGATTLVINKPAGVVQGDVMLATIAATGNGAITAPSGWTVVTNTPQGTALRHATYYKVAGAAEGASYSWSLGTSRSAAGGIVDYSGVNQTAPVDASATATATSGNAVAASVTTSAASDQVVASVSFATATTATPDATTTERYDVSSGSTTSEAADFVQATAGATTAKTVTPAASGSAWIAATIALRDASQAILSVSTAAVPSFSANLNTGDQAKTYTVPLTLNDTRTGASAGLGWNTTVTSTQFLSGSHTLPTNASTVTAVTSACANGGICTTPTNAITYPLAVPAGSTPPTAVKFYNAAAATGIGTFTLTPTVSVTVPQNSFSGTYTSTLTVSVVSGP
jgi:hypothetical protein